MTIKENDLVIATERQETVSGVQCSQTVLSRVKRISKKGLVWIYGRKNPFFPENIKMQTD